MKQRFSTRTRLVSALLTLAMVFTFLPFSAFAATDIYGPVYISNLIFPDETFLNYVKRFDTDNNGTLSPEERYKVTEIDVESKNISNLFGIQFFPNLKNLNCADNNLTSLDVSENTVLAELWCYGNQLTELDVSKNTKLKKLRCQKNQLTSLDVSKNTELEYLAVFYNQLTSLDMSQNRKLTFLSCYNNQLTSLNVSKNPALEELYCAQNNLTSLDVSKNTNLKKLICRANQLTELDVSKNPALDELGCEKNQLTSLDVSENPALLSLKCGENQLTELDVSKNPALRYLNCENSQLTNLNVENTNIDPTPWLFSGLYAPGNAYSIAVGSDRAFDLSNLPGKFDVTKTSGWVGGTASGNTLKVNTGTTQVTYTYDCGKGYSETFTLNVTVAPDGTVTPPSGKGIRIYGDNFPNYEFRQYLKANIDKDGNGYLNDTELNIRTLDVSGQHIANLKGIEFFQNLETLDCHDNKLTSLDVSKNPELKELKCYNNKLTSLDVSKNEKLETLYCSKNQLTSLDVSKNTALKYLWCSQNNLTSLDVTQNTALEDLSCYDNQLTSLDVSKNPALEWLMCFQNKLTKLDVSKNTALKYLDCKENNLTSLDVNQTAVTTLDASDNKIDINVEATSRTFDLSTLPGKFDVTKATNWSGGTVDGSTLTVNEGATQVTYTYDCGKGFSKTFTLNVKVAPEGSIGIDASNFPDPNFRAYVKAKFDKDNDNFLSESERNAVKEITVNSKNITTLEGISYFPNLETLKCYNNQLTSLDVSKNTGLLTLSCYENNLTSLDVSQNTKLEELLCGKNQLTELDVRNNTALWCLSCYENKLTSLDVSHNTQLEQLDCGRNQLTELDVHNNTKLWYLACSENKLTSLDLSQNTKLNELYCSDNQLTSLDLSQTVVTTLKASGNQISINIEETPRTFDLSTLPGFDVSKASGWVGGTVDGSTLKVDAGATQVTYTYDCGKGRSIDFTLNVNVVPDSTVTPPSGGGTGTTTPPSGGGTGTTTPPSGGEGTGTTTPPSGGGTGTTTPPSGGEGTGTTTPPSGGGGTGTTTPPSGGGTGTTTPPSGGEGTGTTTPPSGGGTGTTTPPSGGEGTGTTTPPSGGGTGTTTPPSGGEGTGTTTPPSGGEGTGTTTPPSGGDGGGGAIVMVAGAAVAGVVGYGVYNYVSGQKLQALLPEGVAAPENRAQTALLLWNTAGRPEPAEAPAFADVADPDTAKAAQWCVEQGLMKRRLNGKFAPDSNIPAYQVLNAYRKLAG